MFTLICFLIGIVSILLGGILPPEYTKFMGTLAANSLALGCLVFIVRAFRRRTVHVVIVDKRDRH